MEDFLIDMLEVVGPKPTPPSAKESETKKARLKADLKKPELQKFINQLTELSERKMVDEIVDAVISDPTFRLQATSLYKLFRAVRFFPKRTSLTAPPTPYMGMEPTEAPGILRPRRISIKEAVEEAKTRGGLSEAEYRRRRAEWTKTYEDITMPEEVASLRMPIKKHRS